MRNFRDLSYLGLKKGTLLRSDVLFKLKFKEKVSLKMKHHLRIILDLRRKEECAKLPNDKIRGVKTINVPLINEKASYESKRKIMVDGMQLTDMPYYYLDIVAENKKKAWTKIFDILLNEKGAILIHCSAGKDRTGVVVALFLSLLGYDKETIYKDYLLTNDNPLYYKEKALKYQGKEREIYLDYFQAKSEYLDITYNQIDKQYGSLDNFFKEMCGLSEEKIALLKKKYLPK
ncbi:MAG: tyrosine-protein phosphatase [Bacilli bacterium]|nr:tyrosine-protein phosphatase [Bacilli bacterium]